MKKNDEWIEWEGKLIGELQGVLLSHGICPDCFESVTKPELEEFYQKRSLLQHLSALGEKAIAKS